MIECMLPGTFVDTLMMDFFEYIDDEFGGQVGVGDVIKMLEKPCGSKKRKKRKKNKFIVFEDEVDEDEYIYLDLDALLTDFQPDPDDPDFLPDPDDPDFLPNPDDPDFLDSITQEVSEVTGNILLNEPLEELSKEIASKCKSNSDRRNTNASVSSSTNQKDANIANSLVPNNTSRETSRVTSKTSKLGKSSSTSVNNNADAGSKTVASISSMNSSKPSSSKSSLTRKNAEKSTPSSSSLKINKPGKSASSRSRSTKKKTEVYVPGSYNKEFKFKDNDFPEIR